MYKRPNTDQFNQRGKPFYAICHCTFLGRTRIVNAFKMRGKKEKTVVFLTAKDFNMHQDMNPERKREYFLEICA